MNRLTLCKNIGMLFARSLCWWEPLCRRALFGGGVGYGDCDCGLSVVE